MSFPGIESFESPTGGPKMLHLDMLKIAGGLGMCQCNVCRAKLNGMIEALVEATCGANAKQIHASGPPPSAN